MNIKFSFFIFILKMSYCECCEFNAPNHSRYLKHLGTKKHAKRYLEAIKNLENPNQNIVFSKVHKEEVQEKLNIKTQKKGENDVQNTYLENVQEELNKNTEKKCRKRVQNKKLEENVQEDEQNKNLDENVQELTDFAFLDTHFLDLYKSFSIPLNPTFLWIIQLILSIKFLFHPFSNKTEENDLSGNE